MEPAPSSQDKESVPSFEPAPSTSHDKESVTNSEPVPSTLQDRESLPKSVTASFVSASNDQSNSVSQKISQLENEYRNIEENLVRSLKMSHVSMDDLETYAATLPISVKQYHEELRTQQLLKHATSVSAFAGALNHYSNFLNPALLKDAIKKFGDEETKALMNAYNDKLQEFQKSTLLEQLVDVYKAVTPKGYADRVGIGK